MSLKLESINNALKNKLLLLLLYIYIYGIQFVFFCIKCQKLIIKINIILIGSENYGTDMWRSPRKIGSTLTIEAGFVCHETIQANE